MTVTRLELVSNKYPFPYARNTVISSHYVSSRALFCEEHCTPTIFLYHSTCSAIAAELEFKLRTRNYWSCLPGALGSERAPNRRTGGH